MRPGRARRPLWLSAQVRASALHDMTSLDVDSVASLHSGGGMDSRMEDNTAALVQLGPESDFDWETYM